MFFKKTAHDLCEDESAIDEGIPTLCGNLDDALGNGIPIGVITELIGAPGSGKTQIW